MKIARKSNLGMHRRYFPMYVIVLFSKVKVVSLKVNKLKSSREVLFKYLNIWIKETKPLINLFNQLERNRKGYHRPENQQAAANSGHTVYIVLLTFSTKRRWVADFP